MKSITVLIALALLSHTAQAEDNCIPANEYVPFSGIAAEPNRNGSVSLGMYSRISPDGKYILRSMSGDNLSAATIMEIITNDKGHKVAIAHETGLGNESFPVQGTWRFVNDTGGNHYLLKDILQRGKSADSQFRGGIKGFYAAAAEVVDPSSSTIKIRSLSWPNDNMETNSDKQLKNIMLKTEGNAKDGYRVTSESREHYMCNNLKKTDGNLFSLPMISATGKEFAALPLRPADRQQTMKIYEFAGDNDEDCTKVDDLGIGASKAIFGFPASTSGKAPLVYLGASQMITDQSCWNVTSEMKADPKDPNKSIEIKYDPPLRRCEWNRVPVTGIHLYDRNLKRTFYIGDRTKGVSADSFPGMTKDGRIIYGAQWTVYVKGRKMVDVRKEKREPMMTSLGKPMLKPTGEPIMQVSYYYVKEEVDAMIPTPKVGYVISDPYQSEDIKRFKIREPALAKSLKRCITKEEVAEVERSQKLIYGL